MSQLDEEAATMAEQATEHRRLFYEKIDKALLQGDHTSKPFTAESYNSRVDIIRMYEEGTPKATLHKENK